MKKLYKGEVVEVIQAGETLSKILDSRGNEFSVKTVLLKDLKPTREERYQAKVATIRTQAVSYKVAGWIAAHNSNIHVSTPPKSLDTTIEELGEHGVDFTDETLTVSTDATQGRSYSIVTDNHGLGNELFLATQVAATVYHDNADKVSMQAKEFVLDFLLDELKFQLGTTQDIERIKNRVPAQFLPAFLEGAQIS